MLSPSNSGDCMMDIGKDPRMIARAARIVLYGWLAVQPFMAIYAFFSARAFASVPSESPAGFTDPPPGLEAVDGPVALLLLGTSVLYLVTGVIVLCWIYRTNRNAWAAGDGAMTIRPGWAVGWFFIPVAALWKPFSAFHETWQVSHAAEEPWETPTLLRVWWGCWLFCAACSNLSLRVGWSTTTAGPKVLSAWMDVVEALVQIPLTLLLLRIVADLTAAQMRNLAPGVARASAVEGSVSAEVSL